MVLAGTSWQRCPSTSMLHEYGAPSLLCQPPRQSLLGCEPCTAQEAPGALRRTGTYPGRLRLVPEEEGRRGGHTEEGQPHSRAVVVLKGRCTRTARQSAKLNTRRNLSECKRMTPVKPPGLLCLASPCRVSASSLSIMARVALSVTPLSASMPCTVSVERWCRAQSPCYVSMSERDP